MIGFTGRRATLHLPDPDPPTDQFEFLVNLNAAKAP
jgi:hypothetical protein